eukprot:611063_1
MSWTCSLCGIVNSDDRETCQACLTKAVGYVIGSIDNAIPHANESTISYITLSRPKCYVTTIGYSYSQRTKKHYIIWCTARRVSLVFYAYDIDNHQQFLMTECPLQFNGCSPFMAINTDTNEICLFVNTTRLPATFNVDTKQWNIAKDPSCSEVTYIIACTACTCHKGVYVSRPIEQFCIQNESCNEWSKYKAQTTKYVRMAKGELSSFDHLESVCMVHVALLKIVLLFGGDEEDDWNDSSDNYNQKIFFIKTDKMKNDRARWKAYKALRLPKQSHGPNLLCHCLVLQSVLVLFCNCNGQTVEIWCLDLLFTNKWYKLDKYLDTNNFPDGVIVTKYDDVYVMKVCSLKERDRYMIKFHVSELIPMKLRKRYMQRYSKVVHGFVRIAIEKKYKMQIPQDLKQTVFDYFSPL